MKEEQQQVRWRKRDPLVVGNTVFFSSHSCELSEKEKEKARIELGETDAKKKEFLEELRNKLSKEGKFRTDDAFLLRYIRVRKYDIMKVYDNVKKYYDLKKDNSEIYLIPQDLYSKKFSCVVSLLPYTTETGCLVFWLDFGLWKPADVTYEEAVQPVTAFCDLVSMNPKCQINGICAIWDAKGLSLKHVSELLKKNRIFSLISIGHNGSPWRIKKIIVINTGRIARFFYNAVSPMVSKKLTERVILLGSDYSELHEHINPAILPKKLGGQLDDDFCRTSDLILDNKRYLEYDRTFTGE